eukprot:CAMPEP_0119138806 /NCGR_PEP_ID=MMETSP1310-20130426/26360_1 /TAXON_ID=464262 /ORGANISM="Genus nov. species nov., Strain RCC2339" /LENGTH=51 /DNA_ID=CAMNT_0007130035 /DNA_START=1 /DNA_END=156 /DNA_ORIENTATION=+
MALGRHLGSSCQQRVMRATMGKGMDFEIVGRKPATVFNKIWKSYLSSGLSE